jgi:hypothetical protein
VRGGPSTLLDCAPFLCESALSRQNPPSNGDTRVKSYRIAAIPGDGIGGEVIAAGIRALEACAARDGGFSTA